MAFRLVLFFLGDPWREATVSADGVDVQSTSSQPVAVGDGYHSSDLLTRNTHVNATIKKVQSEGLAGMKAWLADWTPTDSNRELDRAAYRRKYPVRRDE